MDLAANLDKIQIIKIVLQPKIGLMKKEKPNKPNCHKKKAQKEAQKIEFKQPKTIWPKLNPVIACPLSSLASINRISLVSTLNCDIFEALNSCIPKLENHIWFSPKISWEVAPILS